MDLTKDERDWVEEIVLAFLGLSEFLGFGFICET
jgi:hypothetical protein